MRNVIKSLFRRENILVLLLVLGALLGLVGVPQMYGVTSDQIILALLAVLAVDALVEKLGYLDRIETQITDLESKIEPRLSADDVIRSREEMPPFTSWLEKGDEIWLAGKSLHGLITAYGRQIELAANSGTRFRVLLVNPDNSSLMGVYAAGSLGQPTAMSADQLSRTALALFVSLRDNTPQGAVEVRLIDYVPSNTYLIVDGKKPTAQMMIEMYSYKISRGERLHICLTRSVDKRTFAFYLERYERMWQDAKPLPGPQP